MKAYCRICALIQPSSFRPCNDAATGALYEDLCCDTCDFIVATVEERETLAQPAQEPVAVWELFEDGWDSIADPEWLESLPIGTKLYTAPPQRTWVGLTDEETSGFTQHEMSVAKYVSKVLQEKNG